MEAYRQGDVLIVRIEDGERPEFNQWNGVSLPRERGEGLVLAEGEATGHAHRVRASRARMRRHTVAVGSRRTTHTCLYVPPTGAVVEHEEHAPIQLSPGRYEVRRQSEFAPAGSTTLSTSTVTARRSFVAD